MIRKRTQYTDIFLFEKLSQYSEIKHFVSSSIKKENGAQSNDLNISFSSSGIADKVIDNRKVLAEAAEIPYNSFVMQEQVHGNKVYSVSRDDLGKGLYDQKNALHKTDAMITNEKGICLFLFAADCVPILLYDHKNKIIAAVHAGWKGTVQKIVTKTIQKMKAEYASKAKNIIACLGPSISVNNYEIGEEVIREVENSFGTKGDFLLYNPKTKKHHFDLWHSNIFLLSEEGLSSNNIQNASMCTYDNSDLFFSARKKNTGRFAAGIMLC